MARDSLRQSRAEWKYQRKVLMIFVSNLVDYPLTFLSRIFLLEPSFIAKSEGVDGSGGGGLARAYSFETWAWQ